MACFKSMLSYNILVFKLFAKKSTGFVQNIKLNQDIESNSERLFRFQNTISKAVEYSGVGIHTGKEVSIKLLPADEGVGTLFVRTDLKFRPAVLANVSNVIDTSRSTTIGVNGVHIQTVEHLLAALKASLIDNVIIEISNIEPPVGNGSSDIFMDMLDDVEVVAQSAQVEIFSLKQPIFYTQEDIHIVALPSDCYRISYTLDYPSNSFLHSQFCSFEINREVFKKEISMCRTFSLYNELSYLLDKNLIKGGSLENAVVVKDDMIISKNGLFFANEMARHKVLDMIGDLSLIGFDVKAHIIAIKSGHGTNFEIAKKLYNHFRGV